MLWMLWMRHRVTKSEARANEEEAGAASLQRTGGYAAAARRCRTMDGVDGVAHQQGHPPASRDDARVQQRETRHVRLCSSPLVVEMGGPRRHEGMRVSALSVVQDALLALDMCVRPPEPQQLPPPRLRPHTMN